MFDWITCKWGVVDDVACIAWQNHVREFGGDKSFSGVWWCLHNHLWQPRIVHRMSTIGGEVIAIESGYIKFGQSYHFGFSYRNPENKKQYTVPLLLRKVNSQNVNSQNINFLNFKVACMERPGIWLGQSPTSSLSYCDHHLFYVAFSWLTQFYTAAHNFQPNPSHTNEPVGYWS